MEPQETVSPADREAARRLEVEQLDADLAAAGTPGLRLLEDYEVEEAQDLRHRYYLTHYDNAKVTAVPETLAHLPEFVELANHRAAIIAESEKMDAERGAWTLARDRADAEHREAVHRAAVHRLDVPPKPQYEPWPYGDDDWQHTAVMNAFKEQLEVVFVLERAALTENADTYIDLLERAHQTELDELEEAKRRVAEAEARCAPLTGTLKDLQGGAFGPINARTGRRSRVEPRPTDESVPEFMRPQPDERLRKRSQPAEVQVVGLTADERVATVDRYESGEETQRLNELAASLEGSRRKRGR